MAGRGMSLFSGEIEGGKKDTEKELNYIRDELKAMSNVDEEEE